MIILEQDADRKRRHNYTLSTESVLTINHKFPIWMLYIFLKNISSHIRTQLSQQQQKLITVIIHAKPANMCKDCRMSLNPAGIS